MKKTACTINTSTVGVRSLFSCHCHPIAADRSVSRARHAKLIPAPAAWSTFFLFLFKAGPVGKGEQLRHANLGQQTLSAAHRSLRYPRLRVFPTNSRELLFPGFVSKGASLTIKNYMPRGITHSYAVNRFVMDYYKNLLDSYS